jgi:methyl-accepting chemotaxis protein
MATSCWDYMKCGTERTCPAYPDHGRDCWKVSGTLCRGTVQGTPEEKYRDCVTLCKFLEGVISNKID